jgi:hypothetical protein
LLANGAILSSSASISIGVCAKQIRDSPPPQRYKSRVTPKQARIGGGSAGKAMVKLHPADPDGSSIDLDQHPNSGLAKRIRVPVSWRLQRPGTLATFSSEALHGRNLIMSFAKHCCLGNH